MLSVPHSHPRDLTTLGILTDFQLQICWRTCGGRPQTWQAGSPRESSTSDWYDWCINITVPVSRIFDNSKRCVCMCVCVWACGVWCVGTGYYDFLLDLSFSCSLFYLVFVVVHLLAAFLSSLIPPLPAISSYIFQIKYLLSNLCSESISKQSKALWKGKTY